MDQFSHDLTIALEETSLLDRARVSRWGQQRRRTCSTGNIPCAPQPTEDSSSPTELVFGHAAGPHSHATNSYDGLDTQNICLPSDSDDDDKDDDTSLPRLSCNTSTLSVAAIRLGTLESDSLNENFSPSRFFKQAARRKRKLKRISIYYDMMSNLTPTEASHHQSDNEEIKKASRHASTTTTSLLPTTAITNESVGVPLTSLSPSTSTATNLTAMRQKEAGVNCCTAKSLSSFPGTTAATVPTTCSATSTNCFGTVRKRGMKPEAVMMTDAGSNCNRAQLFFYGKRKRLNRDRCHQEHYQDHSFSVPRYCSYLNELKMHSRGFSSTTKPHSDRMLPLNKGLLSKIERIAQQQRQRKQNNLLTDKEVQQNCCRNTDTSDDNEDKGRVGQEKLDKRTDGLMDSDVDLETEVNFKKGVEMSTENKERRRRQKYTPLEQIDKTEVGEMMETSSVKGTSSIEAKVSSTEEIIGSVIGERNCCVEICGSRGNKSEQQDQKETTVSTAEERLIEKPEFTQKRRYSFDQKVRYLAPENQHGTYRIHRKKRSSDPNSNFYYPATDNCNRQGVGKHQQEQQQHLNNSRYHYRQQPHQHQHQHQHQHYKGCQQQFYRDCAGILEFSIDSQSQHFKRQKQTFDVMDCEDFDDFSSSSSLSSSESECGRPSVNDTDREGDDELTDWPGNEHTRGEGLNKYDIKRKLLKHSTLPQIKSDPESLSAILTGEDDTIMSSSSTMGSGGGGGSGTATTSATSATSSNSNTLITAALDWNASHSHPVHSVHSAHLSFPCSEPITIAPRSGTTMTDSVENNVMHGETSNTTSASFMATPQPPPLITPSKLSSTASSNASSCTATSPVEVREIRAGCRRVKGERPGFSIKASINERLARFLQNPQQSQLRLPDTELNEQDSLTNLATLYSLQMSLDSGCVLLNKTSNTTQPINVEQESSDGHGLLNDYKRRCYESKDSELFHK